MKCKKITLICAAIFSANLYADKGLHVDWMDKIVKPQNDFFTYANGEWIKKNPIPSDQASWGTFSVIVENNRKRIHEVLIQASQDRNAKPGSIEQKVGDFYYSGMDIENINKLGVKPLQPELDKINRIANLEDLQNVIIHLHNLGVGVIFGFSSMPDFKDSTKVIAAIDQGGLSLPNRDYYLKQEPKFAKIREEFIKHITNIFMLAGDQEKLAKEKAAVILRMETDLATASLTQVELRNPEAVYHVMDRQQLDKLTPDFSWSKYLTGMGFKDLNSLNMGMPKFMQAVNKAFTEYSINDWKVYLSWHLLSSSAPYLSDPFVEQNFAMVKVLTGMEELPPRWKRVVGAEGGLLGFAVGELFVEKYFSAAAKQEVVDIITNVRKVLKGDLSELSWMTPETRQQALKKLDLIEDRVGYPDKWRDYSSVKIDRGPYILNVLRASKFLVRYDLNKIGKPVDRTEWEMTPQTVNAYYHPSLNSINIPMGILSSPFFDPDATAAVNYGGIGAVIGHEITHGFDDQGAKFDAHGNLQNWWKQEDLEKFKKATQCISEQFSKYTVNGNMPLKGKLVVGEATADLGGLIIAYRAYVRSDAYKNAKEIDGFTPLQQFFISYAHTWANNMRPERAMQLVVSDPHPPAKYRVNGTLANMPEFQKAFNISSNSPMVNKRQCVVW